MKKIISFLFVLLFFSKATFALTNSLIESTNNHTTHYNDVVCLHSIMVDCDINKELCPFSNVMSLYFDSSNSLVLIFTTFKPIYNEYNPAPLLGIKTPHYRPPITPVFLI